MAKRKKKAKTKNPSKPPRMTHAERLRELRKLKPGELGRRPVTLHDLDILGVGSPDLGDAIIRESKRTRGRGRKRRP